MKRYVILLLLLPALTSCAQSPARRLPIAEEMPLMPARAGPTTQPGDLVSFYATAVRLTTSPPNLKSYGIECSVPIESRDGKACFTMAMTGDRRSAFFLFTEKTVPVRDLGKAVSFGGQPDRSLTWGFLYDRNGDGWVDYFTLLDGAQPVKTAEIAERIPKKPGAGRDRSIKIESFEEIQLMMKHTRLLFTHNADDNFDGKSDGVVAPLWDPDNPVWIDGSGVMRSVSFTQEVDEDWRFYDDIAVRSGSVPRNQGRFEVSFFQGPPLEISSRILDSINKGVRACRIPMGTLPKD